MEEADKLREKLAHIRRALLEIRLAEDLDGSYQGEMGQIGDALHRLMDATQAELNAARQ